MTSSPNGATAARDGHGHGPSQRGGRLAAVGPASAVPPHSIEAEEAVLGAAMLTPEACAWLVSNLSEGDF